MSDLSDKILQALLSNGYFPKELPNVFTTEDFGNAAQEIIQEWEAADLYTVKVSKDFKKIGGKRFRGKRGYKKLPSADPEVISKPKKMFERRNLHITHPVPQALLAKEIAENWNTVQKWLSKQTYSVDEIRVSPKHKRAIQDINFPLHRVKTGFVEATSDWLVKTDITRFYPSIYTHSIAWAAYGKEKVKSNLGHYEGSIADRLDLLVRSCNRNQTVGLPIGPETSRIIAEIISSRIDHDFHKSSKARLPRGVATTHSVDRLQDDWTVGVSTLEQAEYVLSQITKCYRDYGLEINGSKTSVTHLIKAAQSDWSTEISAFLSHRRGQMHGARLREFLTLCLKLQVEHPTENVLNYALSIIESYPIIQPDVEILETFLLKAAAISPISLERICRIILNIDHDTNGLSKKRIVTRFIELAERHIEHGAIYEVIWLLFTIRGLKYPFRVRKISEAAENIQSSALRLLLLDLDRLKVPIGSLPKGTWENDISKERSLADWTWLYGYEAVRKGWLKGPSHYLKTPFLKPLDERNVVFYDPAKNVARSRNVAKQRRWAAHLNNIKTRTLIKMLRGVDLSKYNSDY
jgi:hypothetical protein